MVSSTESNMSQDTPQVAALDVEAEIVKIQTEQQQETTKDTSDTEARATFFPTERWYKTVAGSEDAAGIPHRRLAFVASQLKVVAAASSSVSSQDDRLESQQDDNEDDETNDEDNLRHRPEIRTLLDAVLDVVRNPVQLVTRLVRNHGTHTPGKAILKNINVTVKPGEMILVLGRPGSGCSTFLKAFSNQLDLGPVSTLSSDLHVEPGTTNFGGFTATEFKKKYPYQAVYLSEDDFHHAVLSVQQTMEYATSFKTPALRAQSIESSSGIVSETIKESRRGSDSSAGASATTESSNTPLVPGPSRKQYVQSFVQGWLGQFGISHVAKSIVGDAFVRGVSGGERKRVSIAEMLTSRSSFMALDQATKGLDANTALEFAQNLRYLADHFGVAVAVSIYQAADSIYQHFDKLLVLDHGRQVYFGPASEARQYFIDLGYENLERNSTADYVVACTDKYTRTVSPDKSIDQVPSTPAQLEAAYLSSDTWKKEQIHLKEAKQMANDKNRNEEFVQGVAEQNGSSRSKSVYTISFVQQLDILIQRQLQLQYQNVFGLIIQLFMTILIATLIGTVYYKSGTDATGAQSKAALLFTALLFLTLNSFNELPMVMIGRPLQFKQMDYGFYRASAHSLASLVADIPFTFILDLLFCIMIYFMGGLDYNGGAFWTFFAIVYAYHLSAMSMFRTVGAVCPNFDVTNRLATLFIPNMVLYSGYFLQEPNMHRWSFWISYIFPLRYAFDGLLANEFSRVNYQCSARDVVPSGPSYPTFGPNQVCNLPGAKPGYLFVSGSDYIKSLYGTSSNVAWRNFGLLIVYLVGFQLIQMVMVEKVRVGGILTMRLMYQRENEERQKLNQQLDVRRHGATVQEKQSVDDKQNHEDDDNNNSNGDDNDNDQVRIAPHEWPLTFSDLTYEIGSGNNKTLLLDHINGFVKPGTLTALIGVSGAGKTTLLDVLSKRKSGLGVMGVTMLLGGTLPSANYQRGTGYVEQSDVHEPTQTIREAFRFSAYLRQPYTVSIQEKNSYVEEILSLLELQDLADAQIGMPGTGVGLSAEARKRVTMGVELSAKPELLLFLDEPTSGQDGQSAFNTVRFLKKLAARGQAVLCTIHQPNALLFESFDRAIILARGGKCVYFGDVGKGSRTIVNYFETNGASPLPPKANPAEWILEQIGSGTRSTFKDWPQLWKTSQEHQQVKAEIERLNQESITKRQTRGKDAESNETNQEFATPLSYQLKVVTHRMFVSSWRSPDYGWTRFVATTALAAFTSIAFWQLGESVLNLRGRIFAIFMMVVLIPIAMVQIEPAFNVARDIYHREASARIYDRLAFGFAVVVAELPFSLVCAVLFFVTLFYPTGFNYASSHMGYQFLMTFLGQLFATTLGQAVSAITPNMFLATLFNPLVTFLFLLFCGVTIPYSALPAGWRYWMYYLNPATYIISGMVVVELHDLPVHCAPRELLPFSPPSGQTCAKWTADFINRVGGYLVNPNESTICQYCPYANGKEYYTPLNISYDQAWRNIGIVILFIASNLFIVFLGVRFLNFAKR